MEGVCEGQQVPWQLLQERVHWIVRDMSTAPGQAMLRGQIAQSIMQLQGFRNKADGRIGSILLL